MFLLANMTAGGFNFWMGNGEVNNLIYERNNDQLAVFSFVTVVYFIGTEFVPSIAFAITVSTFSRILTEQEQ